MSNMYDILAKFNNVAPQLKEVTEDDINQPVYESVEAKGDIMEAVASLEEKYMGFKAVEKAAKAGGAKDPAAVAASIGRKKYGKAKFQKAAAAGKKLGEAAKPDFLDVDKDGDKKETFKKAVKDKKQVKESANPAAQKGAQAILQALNPQEEQQLAQIAKQAGNDPKRLLQALGITAQDLQQPQVAEGIAPDLKGKIIQALWTAGALGTAAISGAHPMLAANLAVPILMAAGTIWGSEPGQVGSKWDHVPDNSMTGHYELKKGVKPEAPPASIAHNVIPESGGPYELYNPKHPKFKANYEKYKAKHPDCTLAEFVAAMKKREHGVNEGKYDPAAPDAEAIAKRKRLQAIKDRQEDERALGGKDEVNTPIRKVAGKAYGGAAQKDAPETDDLDEMTSSTGGEITRKGNVTTHKAKKYGGEQDSGREAFGSFDRLTAKKPGNKIPDVLDPEDDDLDEVAPPGAKAERMVKHIKKGYAKDGKLTKREKGIAYATAWKAHNRGQVEEGVEFGDTIKNSEAKMTKATIKEGKEAIRNHPIYTDKAAWEHYAKELAEQEAIDEMAMTPGIVDVQQELDEIAALAGLPTREKTCETCGCAESMCECGTTMSEPATIVVGEEEMDEGNEFTKARLDAIAAGKDVFTVGGKTYNVSGDTSDEQVNEDINVSVSAQGEEDVVNLVRKLAGMPVVAAVAEEYCDACDSTECHCDEAVEEERDIELANTPHEETAPISAVTTDAGGGIGGVKKQYPATANRGANPIEEAELWDKYKSMINDIKI